MIDFKSPYSRANGLSFLDRFLPDDFQRCDEEVKPDFKPQFIQSIRKVGEVSSLDNIHVYEITHESENDPRVSLSKDSFRLLAHFNVRKALVFFVSKNSSNYRLSLVTVDLKWESGARVKREYSNPRRYSFFLGPDARVHTPRDFLINKGQLKNVSDLLSRFDVEIVTKEFFIKYKGLYEDVSSYLGKDHGFRAFAEKHGIDIDTFAKKLLGQIVFCYFLQRKGWLGAKRYDSIDKGDKDFMRALFNRCVCEKKNFFNDCLEYLFYGSLNSRAENVGDFYRKNLDCQIPFLNGGLFEPPEDYDWQKSFVHIPDKLFSNRENTGILDVFDLYNFTVYEDDPIDREVSVDPEMLGKVFENLLPENLRKGQGAYYTPREIVHYMCQEGLINYLVTENKVDADKVRNLVINKHFEEKANRELLDKALKSIRVCDPACGSGAFLVGMLHEIVSARRTLDPKANEYHLKKEAIQNCIYGVDIDPGAVDIAKLRLWLSLVVDYELRDIEPLPNLDYKIMCGNSLLEEFEGVRFYDGTTDEASLFKDERKQKIQELREKVREYFNVYDEKEKRKRREEINKLKDWFIKTTLEKRRKEITRERRSIEAKADMFQEKNRAEYFKKQGDIFVSEAKINEVLRDLHNPQKARPFIIWKLEFMDVFEDKGGFDVVIANPPYISFYSRQSRLDEHKGEVEILRKTYQFTNKSIPGRLNSVMFFIEKAIDLLRINGVMSFIIDANFHESSFKYIRKYIVERTSVCYFVDKFSSFECVNSDQVILALRKPSLTRDFKRDEFIYFQDFNGVQNEKSLILPQKRILEDAEFNFTTKNCVVSLDDVKPLDTLYDTVTGVQIGIGGTRKYKGVDIEELFYANSRKNKNYYPIISLKSTDFYRYCKVKFNRFLNFDITLGYEINKAVPKCNIAIPKYEQYLRVPKVIVRQSSASITATYTEDCAVAEYSAFSIKEKMCDCSLKYLLAVLNSSFITYYSLENKIIKTGIKKQPQIRIKGIDSIPIKHISMGEQKPFIGIVDKILAITQDSTYLQDVLKQAKVKECERQIDQMVYKLYGLTQEEINIVENLNK